MNLLTDVYGAFANKPPPGTQLNGHPLADGLWFSYLFNEEGGGSASPGEIDDSSGMSSGVMAFTNHHLSPIPEVYPHWVTLGLRVGNGAGAVRNNKTVLSTFNPVRGSHTVRIVHIPASWPHAFTALLDTAGTAGSGRILNIFLSASGDISYRGIGGSDGTPGGNTSGQELNQINDLVWVRSFGDGTSGSTHTHYWYLNGKLFYTENGLSTVAWPTDGYDMSFGQNPSGGGSIYNGTYVLAQGWDRALSAEEVGLLYDNPYIMYSDGPYMIRAANPAVDATGSGSIPSINLTAPEGEAYEQIDGTGSGAIPSINITAPTGSAEGISTGSGTIPGIQITAPQGSGLVSDYTMLIEVGIIEIVGQQIELKPIPGPDESTSTYVGRKRRGQKVGIFVQAINIEPEAAPTVFMYHEGTTKVKEFQLPLVSATSRLFGQLVYLDDDYDDGHYVAVIQYSQDVWTSQHYRQFEVIGGEGVGHVLACHVVRRTIGTGIIKHTQDGTIRIGYNPRLEE